MKPFICSALAMLLGLPLMGMGQDIAQPKKPDAQKKAIFDEKADAKTAIDKALAAAKRANRRVLIQWGSNDSESSVALHDHFKTDKALPRLLLYEYDLVFVDAKSNLELAAKHGADLKKNTVPYLTVLDADGNSLTNQSTVPFETKDNDKIAHDPKKLHDFLTRNQATPLKAEEELKAAFDKAEKTNRHVFLHFGAPWCGWCKKLDAWLVRPDIAAVFGKEFVDIEIDIDRMTGGKDVQAKYRPSATGGIPWFVMLDTKGKELVNSDGPKGNVGFPYTDDEIAHFVVMLKTCKRHLNDADIEMLRTSLIPEPKIGGSR